MLICGRPRDMNSLKTKIIEAFFFQFSTAVCVMMNRMMFTSFKYIVLLLIIPIKGDHVINWNYGDLGPDVWGDTYAACYGQKQSPINIRTKCTVEQAFTDLQLSIMHAATLNFSLKNNGHTIAAKTDASLLLNISGSDFNEVFYFDSFHLHWGPNYRSGSEHQV